MLPISLKLKGLYSYQDREEQHIDFRRLCEAHLFGIFGGVGSGKSSILDAITFALYGEVDRLSKTGDNRYFNMMNARSNSLLIEFEFENHAGTLFKAVVSGKRKRNSEEVDAFTRKVYEWKNEEWIPHDFNGEKLTGLSYENFRRTIIIPQGKFQEFLELGAKDRTDMLKDIFQLDKYEFGSRVGELLNKNKLKLSGLEGEMKQFEGLSTDAIHVLKTEIEELTGRLNGLAEEIVKLEVEEQAGTALQILLREAETIEKNLREHLSGATENEELKRELKAYQSALAGFKSLLDLRKEKQSEQVQKRNRLLQLEKEQAAAELNLKSNKESLQTLLPAFESRQKELELAADYIIAVDCRTISAALAKAETALKTGEQYIAKQQTEKEQLKKILDGLKAAISQERAALPDWGVLSQLNTWFAQAKPLQTLLQSETEQWQQAEKDAAKHHDALTSLIDPTIREQVAHSANQHTLNDALNDLVEGFIEQEEKLQSLKEELRIKARLNDFALNLEEGKPCPLCGSVHHPEKLSADESEQHQMQVQTQLATIHQLKEASRKTQSAFATWFQLNERYQKALEQQKTKTETAKLNWETFKAAFNFPGFALTDEEKVAALLTAVQEKQKEIAALETQKEKAETASTNAEQLTEKAHARILTLQSERAALKGRLDATRLQLKQCDPDAMQEDNETLLQLAIDLKTKVALVEKQMESLKTDIGKSEQEAANTQGQLSSLQIDLEALHTALINQDTALDAALKASDFMALEEVELILTKRPDVKAMEERMERYQTRLTMLRADQSRLARQTAGKVFNSSTFDELKLHLTELKTIRQQENDRTVELKKAFKDQTEGLKQRSDLQKELDRFNERQKNLQTLKSLFMGSGFVKYISTVFLHQLCNAANARFHQLTRQQLHLEVDDNYSFQVQDLLNDGKQRSAKTLSGGQKFQASLCLALALAESVQGFAKADKSFFFLDEGFGSLDKEALQTVFEALKALRKENRIVGLISHVEELQQEIDRHVRISNDPETGSFIVTSE